jgi:hypothetical protein
MRPYIFTLAGNNDLRSNILFKLDLVPGSQCINLFKLCIMNQITNVKNKYPRGKIWNFIVSN